MRLRSILRIIGTTSLLPMNIYAIYYILYFPLSLWWLLFLVAPLVGMGGLIASYIPYRHKKQKEYKRRLSKN